MMRRKHILYIFVTLVAAVSGCTMQKQCPAPDGKLPDQVLRPDLMAGGAALGEVPADTLAFSDMEWWTLYADSLLNRLIRKTLENNRDMRAAIAKIRELRYTGRAAIMDQLPKVSARAAYENEIMHYYGKDLSPDPEMHLKGIVSWEFNLLGASVWKSQRESDRYLASVEGQRSLQMSLIAEVVTAYFELISLDQQMAIIEQTVAVRRETTEKTRLRFLGGLTSETAYRQAIVEYASAAALVPDMEKRIALKEHQLAWLAGEFPTAIERSRLTGGKGRTLDLSAGIPSDLLLRRPDVRRARVELDAAMANAGFHFANRFPTIRLSFAGGFENNDWQHLLQAPYLYPIAALTSPLFAFGTNQARYRAAVQQYMQQKALYEKTVLTAFREVNDAMVVYRKTREETMLLENLQDAALKYVELADLQYLNGVISYMDVLDAQRKYFSAQLDLARNKNEERIALVRLYKALGGGWSEELPAGALTRSQERRQEKVVKERLSDSTAARPGLTPEETLRENYRLYLGHQVTERTEKL
ncbi:MAG: TolC family protein, partial [Bacteroidales bacterium]|nr:TolC family protein [Bacteroidales bacterium]